MVLLYKWVPFTMVSEHLHPPFPYWSHEWKGMSPWLDCYLGMTFAEGGVQTACPLLTVAFPLKFFLLLLFPVLTMNSEPVAAVLPLAG